MADHIDEREHARLTKKLMKPWFIEAVTMQHSDSDGNIIEQQSEVLVACAPFVTSKGNLLLNLQAGVYLDLSQATLLRNWLSDYIGHTQQILDNEPSSHPGSRDLGARVP